MKNCWLEEEEKIPPVIIFTDEELRNNIANIDEIFAGIDFEKRERRVIAYLMKEDAIGHSALGYYWGFVEVYEYWVENDSKGSVTISYIHGKSFRQRTRSCFASYGR